MSHKFFKHSVGFVVAWGFKNLGTVLKTASKNSLGTKIDLGFVKRHTGATVGLFEMSLVCRLPVKNHVATFLPAKPLSIGIMEILDMSLQIIFACTRLLDILFPTKTACERTFLFRRWCG
jgi:hypothetical protein